MGTLGKWILGMIILGIAALLFEFTPWGGSARSANMGNSIQAALNANNMNGITTAMSGNVAKLSGDITSEQARQAAVSIAQNAQCEKCGDREAGKRWHEVDGSGLKIAVASISPYTLTGLRTDDGGIVLDGYAQNADEKASMLAAAEAAFPGNVTDNTIKIAPGAPNAHWLDVARANIAGLGSLESGQFGMEDLNSVLRGQTASVELRTSVNLSIDGLPEGYNGAANIVVPDAAAINTGQIKSANICQELFETIKGESKVNFAYNRAEIRGLSSISLLNNLASAATQCSSFRIAVEGHTDADGSAAYNLGLSRRRAEAVKDYLVQNGVDSDNVTGGGYGESRPIASNDTPQGMAANRRIEFTITRSE